MRGLVFVRSARTQCATVKPMLYSERADKAETQSSIGRGQRFWDDLHLER